MADVPAGYDCYLVIIVVVVIGVAVVVPVAVKCGSCTDVQDGIRKPILRTADKSVKKEAPEIFRDIQAYMGDRSAYTLYDGANE